MLFAGLGERHHLTASFQRENQFLEEEIEVRSALVASDQPEEERADIRQSDVLHYYYPPAGTGIISGDDEISEEKAKKSRPRPPLATTSKLRGFRNGHTLPSEHHDMRFALRSPRIATRKRSSAVFLSRTSSSFRDEISSSPAGRERHGLFASMMDEADSLILTKKARMRSVRK